MPVERVTATEAARKFSDLLNRVRYRGETFEVVRGGVVIARLVPAEGAGRSTLGALRAALARVEPPDSDFARDVEALQAAQRPPEDPWGT